MALVAETWICCVCGVSRRLNLPKDLEPPPKCTTENCGASMIPQLRHECSSCGVIYGEGKNKPIRGWCVDCWKLTLLEQQRNTRRAWSADERTAGRLPLQVQAPFAWRPPRILTTEEIEHAFRAGGSK